MAFQPVRVEKEAKSSGGGIGALIGAAVGAIATIATGGAAAPAIPALAQGGQAVGNAAAPAEAASTAAAPVSQTAPVTPPPSAAPPANTSSALDTAKSALGGAATGSNIGGAVGNFAKPGEGPQTKQSPVFDSMSRRASTPQLPQLNESQAILADSLSALKGQDESVRKQFSQPLLMAFVKAGQRG